MGFGPSEARNLTWWEFTAMRAVWNERHNPDADGDGEFESPEADFVRREMARYGEAVH